MAENLNKKPPKGILKSSSSFDTASCGVSSSSANSASTCSSAARRNSGSLNNAEGKCDLLEDEDAGGGGGEGYVHVRKHSKTAKFDEMNILETYHPATKTYGHMKIEEPKTPFSYYEDADEELESAASSHLRASSATEKLDASELARRLEENIQREAGHADVVADTDRLEDDDDSDDEAGDEDPESRENRVKFESKRKAHYNEYYAVKLARKLMEQEEDDDEEDAPALQDQACGGIEFPCADKFIPEEETRVNECDDVVVVTHHVQDDGGGAEKMVDG